jgi:hypothetical protein
MQPGQDLAAVKDLPPPVFFDDQGQSLFHPFIGRKTTLAMGAFPAATDDVAIFAHPRINNPVVNMLAEGATQ